MARLSLILPLEQEDPPVHALVESARRALVDAGHDVEVVLVGTELAGYAIEGSPASWRRETVADSGRSPATVAGLERTDTPFCLVLDPSRGYSTADIVAVANALTEGRSELVIGSRRVVSSSNDSSVKVKTLRGKVANKLIKSSDPFSGLVGISRATFDEAKDDFLAVGSFFALELLAKVKEKCLDVPCGVPTGPVPKRRPSLNTLRHAKRLSDHRFGNLSRLLQFCVVGASGMIIDLSLYAAFQAIFAQTILAGRNVPVLGSLDLAVAAFLSVAIALCWNFSLNRRLTFSYARHGSLARQFVTYVLSNALAVTLNLTLRLSLPRAFTFFDHHRLAAAVVGVVMATGVSFSMSRWFVFSHGNPTPEPAGDDVNHPGSAVPEPTVVR